MIRIEPVCPTCGKVIPWGRRWAADPTRRQYCSDDCGSRRVAGAGQEIERLILTLLEQRAVGASICPSEVARALTNDDWRAQMEAVRRAARRLQREGRIEITRGGRPLAPGTERGPIRLRLRPLGAMQA